ncbi:hypothetical protein THAOC_23646 [Thalassiosira oceanica]|uniref:SMP-30/Gluconolactonase/LRE-like region domain-containing protein n=1 Tax=Thalassiosira oceanica TaxID=159749 RepID=K0S6C4_THAOC|nr:hypothetical protein THAOC_23646 [Thalassiosira oceanica]|eukprot:EJK56461.1 hypothetical protein THAOC_23646 [Thalassiosira oceanica]
MTNSLPSSEPRPTIGPGEAGRGAELRVRDSSREDRGAEATRGDESGRDSPPDYSFRAYGAWRPTQQFAWARGLRQLNRHNMVRVFWRGLLFLLLSSLAKLAAPSEQSAAWPPSSSHGDGGSLDAGGASEEDGGLHEPSSDGARGLRVPHHEDGPVNTDGRGKPRHERDLKSIWQFLPKRQPTRMPTRKPTRMPTRKPTTGSTRPPTRPPTAQPSSSVSPNQAKMHKAPAAPRSPVYVAGRNNHLVRRVDRHGRVTTVAGRDGEFNDPADVGLEPDDGTGLLVVDRHRLHRVDLRDGTSTVLAGGREGGGGRRRRAGGDLPQPRLGHGHRRRSRTGLQVRTLVIQTSCACYR